MRFALSFLAAFVFATRQAHAHAFEAGADSYAQFLEGIGVIIFYPSTLLSIAALGVLLVLWELEGLLKVWLPFVASLLVGFVLAAFVGPWVSWMLLTIGLLTACLGALFSNHTKTTALLLTIITGVFATAVSLEGHEFFELGFFIYFGIFVGANLTLAVSAGIIRFALETVDKPFMRIGARVSASWIAAVLVLTLAFTFSNAA